MTNGLKDKQNWWVACMFLMATTLSGCSPKTEREPSPSQAPVSTRHALPKFTPVPGTGNAINGATLFTVALPDLGSTLRIRTVTIPPQEVDLPISSEMLLEVRSGDLITVTEGRQNERQPGDMWLAIKGSRVRMKALHELAVVRLIDLVSTTE